MARDWLRIVRALLPTAVLFATAPQAWAQDAGVVTGDVIEAGTLRPLVGAQVFVPGTQLGALTNNRGRFRLVGVPTGEVEVRVEIIGYGEAAQRVQVTAGEIRDVRFTLEERAIALDEIVVTGAGQAVERRKLGNTIATIDARALENVPAANLSEILQGREPGVVGLPSGGITGEGARIRIRGSASLSQSNEPIIYVDGVRVDRSGGFSGRVRSAGGQPSRLDDIPPEAIERIEILKGAAAATLYGTEASNGVIQIFTKRGQSGPPRWSFTIEEDVIRMPTDRLIPFADWARNQDDVARVRERWGLEVKPYEPFQVNFHPEFFETGLASTASASVSGAGPSIEYFVSGRYAREDGPLGLEDLGPSRDTNEKKQVALNLGILPSEDLRLRFSSFYAQADHETPNINNTIHGAWPVSYRAKIRLANRVNRLYGNPSISTVREGMQIRNTQSATNFAGSVSLQYTPVPGFAWETTLGVADVNQRDAQFFPFGWNVDIASQNAAGRRDISDRNHREVTLDVKSGWNAEVGRTLTSALTLGAQGFIAQTSTSGGQGDAFPGPGLEVAGAAASQQIDESWLRNVNAGVYAQEQIGYRDFAFLTLGMRWDANSAFGEEFAFARYPKASVSVVPSDIPGWTGGPVSTLRLRAAIGQSGLQPGTFDRFTTYAPIGSAEGAGIRPDNLGNPELRPEISTEWEVGTEIGLLQDRWGFELTYWNRAVTDALVSREFPVSGGFRAPQLVNAGRLEAWGLELGVEGAAHRSQRLSVELFANGSYLHEEVGDLGGAPPLKVGGSYVRYRNWIREGYAPGSFFGPRLANVAMPLDLRRTCTAPSREEALRYFSSRRSLDDFEVLVEDCGTPAVMGHYLGKPTPDWQGSFGANVGFLRRLRVRTLFEFRAGNFWVHDLSGAFRRSNRATGRNTPEAARVEATMEDPASTAEQRLEAALQWTRLRALSPFDGLNEIHRADFLRWRELSLTYAADELARRLGLPLESLAVTFAARNLKLWVHPDYTGLDPEINQLGRCGGGGLDCNFLDAVEAWGVPLPRRFSLRVSAGL
ncbi:MAG: SusC/RagA family TonB-linked outer membrane protein [Gemmatimonadetes bacterium]|nr:SusC/RagA family TonB-linked outer membrane protein [Gemmatimonadota bacterium]